MKTQHLELGIEALKNLRAEIHQKTDAGVVHELDEVILQFENCLLRANKSEVEIPSSTRGEALEVLSNALSVLSNLAELIRLFSDMS